MLHLACGNGALTKLLFSSGLQVGPGAAAAPGLRPPAGSACRTRAWPPSALHACPPQSSAPLPALPHRPLQVIGVDEDVAEAKRRGLPAVQLHPLALGAGALEPELAAMGAFDAAVFLCPSSSSDGSSSADGSSGSSGGAGLAGSWWQPESLAELLRVLRPGGKLCVQAPLADEAAVRVALQAAGLAVQAWERADCGATRLVAVAPAAAANVS